MVAINFNKAIMHRVPTYDEIIKETITHPTDKIQLPDRMATRLRNLPQLTRFDEVDVNSDHDSIQAHRAQLLSTQAGLPPGGTMSLAHAATEASPPPPPPTPPGYTYPYPHGYAHSGQPVFHDAESGDEHPSGGPPPGGSPSGGSPSGGSHPGHPPPKPPGAPPVFAKAGPHPKVAGFVSAAHHFIGDSAPVGHGGFPLDSWDYFHDQIHPPEQQHELNMVHGNINSTYGQEASALAAAMNHIDAQTYHHQQQAQHQAQTHVEVPHMVPMPMAQVPAPELTIEHTHTPHTHTLNRCTRHFIV